MNTSTFFEERVAAHRCPCRSHGIADRRVRTRGATGTAKPGVSGRLLSL